MNNYKNKDLLFKFLPKSSTTLEWKDAKNTFKLNNFVKEMLEKIYQYGTEVVLKLTKVIQEYLI